MIGVMAADEIETTLRRHRVGRIGCSVNDRPYVVPISYAYDGTYVYGYGALGRKIEVMREQPLVCFEVDEIQGESSWRSVIAEGRYEELAGGVARQEALTHLALRGDDLVARSPDPGGHVIVFRLRLTERSGRFERRDA
jgi:uncharacterized protein